MKRVNCCWFSLILKQHLQCCVCLLAVVITMQPVVKVAKSKHLRSKLLIAVASQ
ncbi:hypothetical protein A2U01_0077180, partial [Trifolium medium]|nr:hypothetical protein [Trifolium medium]